MSCVICGRGSCCKSFHSLEEQEKHDESVSKVKELIYNKIDRLRTEEIDNKLYVDRDEVLNIIDNI